MQRFLGIYSKVFFFVFRLGCVGVVIAALYFSYYGAKLDSNGVEAQARFKSGISYYTPNADRQGNFDYYTVELFYEWHGAEYSNGFFVSVGDFPQVQKGRLVTIEVLPSAPQWSRIPGQGDSPMMALVVVVVAVLLLAFSFFLTNLLKRNENEEPKTSS